MSPQPRLPPIEPVLGPTGFGPLASMPGAMAQTAPKPQADTLALPETEVSGQAPFPHQRAAQRLLTTPGETPRSVAVVPRGVKPLAGRAVLGRATGLQRVGPVTRGARPAGSSRVRSTARDAGRRTLLFDLDTAIDGPHTHPPAGHVCPVRFIAVHHTPIRRRADA